MDKQPEPEEPDSLDALRKLGTKLFKVSKGEISAPAKGDDPDED